MAPDLLSPLKRVVRAHSRKGNKHKSEGRDNQEGSTIASVTSTQHSPTPPLPPPRDLWRDAFDKLPKGTQQEIGTRYFDQKSQREHIHELLEVTKARQEECENKFWKFRVGGHEIVIRDYAVRIVDCLQKIGDIAIQFAPPQASVPWSIVKIVLQVCHLLCW